MQVTLLGVPARLFGEMRRYHFEVRRELRLLAMTAPDDYPLATRSPRSSSRPTANAARSAGISRLDQAIADGARDASTSSTACRRAHRRRWRASATCSTRSTRRSPGAPARAAAAGRAGGPADWYFTEFERQGNGEEPLRWTGPTSMPARMTAGGCTPHPPAPRLPSASWPRVPVVPSAPCAVGADRRLPGAGGQFPWTIFADQRDRLRACSPRCRCPGRARRHHWLGLLLGTGVLGGFTTMSAASVETFDLLDRGTSDSAWPTAWARLRPPSLRCLLVVPADHRRAATRVRGPGRATSDRAAGGPRARRSGHHCATWPVTCSTDGVHWGTLVVNLVGSFVLGALSGPRSTGTGWRCWAPASAAG